MRKAPRTQGSRSVILALTSGCVSFAGAKLAPLKTSESIIRKTITIMDDCHGLSSLIHEFSCFKAILYNISFFRTSLAWLLLSLFYSAVKNCMGWGAGVLLQMNYFSPISLRSDKWSR